MISHKLSNFRAKLESMGMAPADVQQYLEAAGRDIQDSVRGIVGDAVREAADMGQNRNAEDFLSEVSLDVESGYVQVTTDSTNTDFSKAPFPMLPWLLKNAKIAADGSRYKVIPVGAKSDRPRKPVKNIEAGLASLQDSSKRGVGDMAADLAAAFGMGANNKIKPPDSVSSGASKPSFRIASSKQDPNAKWVTPAKDLDLSGSIMEINLKIRQRIDAACDEAIDYHSREAEEWHG